MLAGFSFISRISKYFLERCNILNYSEEEYTSFYDEEDTNKQFPLDKIELKNKNNKNLNDNSIPSLCSK